jgi:hypothetical protein
MKEKRKKSANNYRAQERARVKHIIAAPRHFRRAPHRSTSPHHLYFAPKETISTSRGSYVPSDEALLLPQTALCVCGEPETFPKADVSFSTPVRACARAEFQVLGK